MEWMFRYNPKNRPTCEQIMKHEYFTEYVSATELQRAFEIIQGKRKEKERKSQSIERLKIGPNGI